MHTLHKAKAIITEDKPLVGNHAILTEGSRIIKIGKYEDFGDAFKASTIDHGNALISPGFINLHAHLLYSSISLIKTELGLFTWLEKLTDIAHKMPEEDLKKSLERGINQTLSFGTTFIVENTPSPLSAEMLSKSPLKALIGLEVFGSDENEAEQIFNQSLQTLQECKSKYNTQSSTLNPQYSSLNPQYSSLNPQSSILNPQYSSLNPQSSILNPQSSILNPQSSSLNPQSSILNPRLSFTFSPHAPYDVSLPLWKLLTTWSKQNNQPLLTHLEESPSEKLWWQKKEGPALKFWQKINKLEPKLKYWRRYESGIDFLSKNNLLDTNLIATHLTNATTKELELLEQNNIKCVHCPRSNFNLNNGTANLQRWQESKLLFGLGTDSTASSDTLNLIDEVRFAIQEQEKLYGLKLSNKTAFDMLTKNAAQILNMENKIGCLKEGADADFLILDTNGKPDCTYSDPFEFIIWKLNIVKDLKEVWINGKKTWRASSILNKI